MRSDANGLRSRPPRSLLKVLSFVGLGLNAVWSCLASRGKFKFVGLQLVSSRIALTDGECHVRHRGTKKDSEFAGAFYHVICLGNQRLVNFRSDADRKYYLERLEPVS